jgi:hypothetical protein
MDIKKAKQLVYGASVHCPADRGEPPYYGIVRHIGADVFKNIHGHEYIWVTVSKNGNTRHVWPSIRLT